MLAQSIQSERVAKCGPRESQLPLLHSQSSWKQITPDPIRFPAPLQSSKELFEIFKVVTMQPLFGRFYFWYLFADGFCFCFFLPIAFRECFASAAPGAHHQRPGQSHWQFLGLVSYSKSKNWVKASHSTYFLILKKKLLGNIYSIYIV